MMRVRDTSDAPALDLVSLADAKAYLRVDTSAEDDLIEDLIQVASDQIAAETNTRWKSVNAYGYLEDFVSAAFPVGPVTAITAVEYKASGDTYTTLPTSKYHFAIETHPARIVFDDLPSLEPDAMERIRITFTYGFTSPNTAPHPTPPQYAQAIKMLTAHLYDFRSPVYAGQKITEVPMGVKNLINVIRQL